MAALPSPPTYEDSISSPSSPSEKAPSLPERPSETPLLDAHFRQSNIRQHLLTLSGAIGSLGEENASSRPAAESIGRALMAYKADLKAAQKSGSISKEDKKAMKREGKMLMKSLKHDFKGI